ncbi:alpha/beta hydrolase [Pseudonocardiaceae bacterium YIM PH 21723]|nr:alpha/beta hydrolase [Pseudonocardiaceae bacterium YIM PH 21723]
MIKVVRRILPVARRSLVNRAVLASALSASLLLSTVTAATAAGRTPTWAACGPEQQADCTTVTVPVDWAKPGGPTINLEVTRRRADPAKRLGVLFFGDGGPGGRSADAVKGAGLLDAGLTEKYDLVGVNARGLGKGYELNCPAPATAERRLPATEAEFAGLRKDNRSFGASCQARSGAVYAHLDTASNARDLDAVRAALGEEKAGYYGVSYGTLLGQQFAELFPQRVSRMVLDSSMDHSQPDARSFMVSEAAGAERDFDRFTGWCAADASCALHGRDVRALITGLQQRADRGELRDVNGAALTPLTLNGIVSGGRSLWAHTATELQQLADTGRSGESNITAPWADNAHTILCQDWNLNIRDLADLKSIVDDVQRAAPMTRLSGYAAMGIGCIGQPVSTVNPPAAAGPQPTQALVLNARYDHATVYPWAQNLTRQTGWTLLTYDDGGHGMYFTSYCMKRAADDYLLTGRLPAAGTECAREPQSRQRPEPEPEPEPEKSVWF